MSKFKYSVTTPILFLTYNKPKETIKVLKQILKVGLLKYMACKEQRFKLSFYINVWVNYVCICLLILTFGKKPHTKQT